LDRTPEGARGTEANVVGEDEEHVGRALGWLDRPGEVRLRVLHRAPDLPLEGCIWPRQHLLGQSGERNRDCEHETDRQRRAAMRGGTTTARRHWSPPGRAPDALRRSEPCQVTPRSYGTRTGAGPSRYPTARPGRSAARDAGHPVGAPVLAPHSAMDHEEPVRVVLLLDAPQARVVAAPERALPALLEVVALRDVRAGVGHELPDLRHRRADLLRLLLRLGLVRRVAGDARVYGISAA